MPAFRAPRQLTGLILSSRKAKPGQAKPCCPAAQRLIGDADLSKRACRGSWPGHVCLKFRFTPCCSQRPGPSCPSLSLSSLLLSGVPPVAPARNSFAGRVSHLWSSFDIPLAKFSPKCIRSRLCPKPKSMFFSVSQQRRWLAPLQEKPNPAFTSVPRQEHWMSPGIGRARSLQPVVQIGFVFCLPPQPFPSWFCDASAKKRRRRRLTRVLVPSRGAAELSCCQRGQHRCSCPQACVGPRGCVGPRALSGQSQPGSLGLTEPLLDPRQCCCDVTAVWPRGSAARDPTWHGAS